LRAKVVFLFQLVLLFCYNFDETGENDGKICFLMDEGGGYERPRRDLR